MADPGLCARAAAALARRRASSTLRDRRRRVVAGAPGARITIGGRALWCFSGNAYLGLACHPRVIEAARREAAAGGCSASSSRLVCGNLAVVDELEVALARLKDQQEALVFSSGYAALLGLSARPAILLAEKLAALCPGDLERVFYSDAGATAVEVALKIAAQRARLVDGEKTPRRRFLTLDDAYHGDTMGAVSLGFSPGFHRAFEHLAFPVGRLPRDVDGAVAAIRACGLELCAVVLEPLVQGAAGMLLQPPGFLSAVAEAARAAGALLICDEVATGFWRTGRRFACEHEGVVPDVLCLAKGLTGGYLPLAATVVTPAVFGPFASGQADGARTFFHGHTYTGNALACAAALAAVDELERLAARGRIAALEAHLAQALASLADHPHVLEVRRRGLMVGIELVADRRAPRRFARTQRVGHRVAHHGRAHGVLLRPLGDVMVLLPPFSFSDAEIERAVAAVRNGIDAVCPDAARAAA